MLLYFPFFFSFVRSSKSTFENKKLNSCVPAVNEFEYEGFVYSIIYNTSTVSIKCPILELSGIAHIPSIATRTNNQNNSENFTVVEIQSDCFRNQCRLTSIYLPETITKIGQFAFFNCVRLNSIRYPSKMTMVPQSCFYGCISLESITLPLNTVKIEDYSFYRCELLRYFKLPNSVQSIGAYSFSFCRCIVSTLEIPHF